MVAHEDEQRTRQLIRGERVPGAHDAEMEDIDQKSGDGGSDDQHRECRDIRDKLGIAGASHRACKDQLGGLERLDESDKEQDLLTGTDDFVDVGIETDDLAACDKECRGKDQSHEETGILTGFTVGLRHIGTFFAKTLSDQGRGGDREGLTVHERQGLDVHADGMGRVGIGPEGSDDPVVKDHACTHDELLAGSGKTDPYDIGNSGFLQFETGRLPVKTDKALVESDDDHRDHKSCCLTDYGRDRRAADLQTRETELSGDQDVVEENIDRVGDHVIDQRRSCIADAAQRGRYDVGQSESDHTDHHDLKIFGSGLQRLQIGRADESAERAGKDVADDGHDDGEDKGQ